MRKAKGKVKVVDLKQRCCSHRGRHVHESLKRIDECDDPLRLLKVWAVIRWGEGIVVEEAP